MVIEVLIVSDLIGEVFSWGVLLSIYLYYVIL